MAPEMFKQQRLFPGFYQIFFTIPALISLSASFKKSDMWNVGKCDIEIWEFWSIISSLNTVWDGSEVIVDELQTSLMASLIWTITSLMILELLGHTA